VFRPNQIFFRWYGRKYRHVLDDFDWLFVQDSGSLELLKRFGLNNVTISGDTRFDRVLEIAGLQNALPSVEKLAATAKENDALVLVAGSTWEKDEDVIIPYFNRNPSLKLIIAPHEMDRDRINALLSKIERPAVLYSSCDENDVAKADCLIIDCFGLLSSVYRFGDIAYIGGGFGNGIHNVLEAAVYGVPVIFGPNYQKFREARDLIKCGGANSITDQDEFSSRINEYIAYTSLRHENGEKAKDYVSQNLNATHKIYEKIFPTKKQKLTN
jgi:3-deoxy-D-manno-octulosonic-acid transferase